MGKNLKGILLGYFVLLVGILGLMSMDKEVSAGVGQTFNENFADNNLASIVAQKLYKTADDTITATDVQNLKTLSISYNKGIRDLTGVETFTSLDTLVVWNNPIDTLPENIDDLTLLRVLTISDTKFNFHSRVNR
ncbi:hypothetical protein AZF37_02820 [endosymbiont 'TC1' of Trimyema compressum]|uniref:hypothetical protein n=1 Tax=endosymbiont 'TC1' of Trimyema compressum TaxID=243899 RepID=UPI0007F10177|nr:hypothetical protein [endosymbiont 'TC1' of Trimyema compressum]AMP20247.1 hypothetical protein AZF37_02820 [endosymbiont 'TC1' of Trimyema compressum]